MGNSGISILISTCNGAVRIEETLQALSILDISGLPFVELIVVDNASTDRTLELAEKSWGKLGNPFPFVGLTEKNPGKLNAQETGIAHAKGEFIVICDDDNLLFPDYLQVGFAYLTKNLSIGVLGAKGIAKSTEKLPEWFEQYSYHFACGKQAPETGNVVPVRNVVYGAGMWFRKDLYQKAKQMGFHFMCNFSGNSSKSKSSLNGGEDSELCWAIRFQGAEIWYIDELYFYHNLPKERLTDTYLNYLKNRIDSNGPYGSIYYRVWNSSWKEPVKMFWLKELIHSLIYLVKIGTFTKVENRKIEINRTIKNIAFYSRERSNFDRRVNHLIEYKRKIFNN